jgi:murein DD-endopeptidase MepM/ murein hydrolase activator NlpD
MTTSNSLNSGPHSEGFGDGYKHNNRSFTMTNLKVTKRALGFAVSVLMILGSAIGSIAQSANKSYLLSVDEKNGVSIEKEGGKGLDRRDVDGQTMSKQPHLVSTEFAENEGPEAGPRFTVQLWTPGRGLSDWQVNDIRFTSWSGDHRYFALETDSNEVLVGDALSGQRPMALSTALTTPSLSADGSKLIAQRLGNGDRYQDRLMNSPGLLIVDLATRIEQSIGEAGAFDPFFISPTEVGFGQANQSGVVGLYMIDLGNGSLFRLTNKNGSTEDLDPFPEEAPIFDADSKSLIFRSTNDDGEHTFRLILDQKTAVPTEASDINRPRNEQAAQQLPMNDPKLQSTAVAAVKFRLPIDPKYYTKINSFFDHGGRDWAGGSILYDGHTGTDFAVPIDTPILAAASGVPYYVVQGCPNAGSWTSTCGGGYGNHVRLRHSDGRVSVYGHMKDGTLIKQSSTNPAGCGTQIGLSASSGKSTGPHVHWELWSDQSISKRIDPYLGPYNQIGTTEWVAQNSPYPSGLVGSNCQEAGVSPARVVATSSLKLNPSSNIKTNQAVTATISFTNKGGEWIVMPFLGIGGRLDGDPNCVNGCPDFPFATDVRLNPGQTYTVSKTRPFSTEGNYRFFAAYRKPDLSWITNVDQDSGVSNYYIVGIFGTPRPTVSSSPRITTPAPYKVTKPVGITITVTNRGDGTITFAKLGIGGRLNGDQSCSGGCPDFPFVTNVTLAPGRSYTFTSSQLFTRAGTYQFFAAYQNKDGTWITNVDKDSGISNSVSISITK